MKPHNRILLVLLIISLAALVRFAGIDTRSLHYDEGTIWYYFLDKIGHGEPIKFFDDFYGFSSFYLMALPMRLFGDGLFGIRFANTLTSCLVLYLWYLLVPVNRLNKGFFIGLAMTAGSPSLIYYANYASQHIFLIFFMFTSILMLDRYLRSKKLLYMIWLSICLGLMLAGHALSFVFVSMIGVILIIEMIYIAKFVPEKVASLKFNYTHLLTGLLLVSAVIVMTMTSGLTDFSNLNAFLLQFLHQIQKTHASVHDKGFAYYIVTFVKLEPFAFAGCVLSLWFLKKTFFNRAVILFTWLVVLFLSLMPYKIPWLFTLALYPMYFLSILTLSEIFIRIQNNKMRLVLLYSVLVGIFAWTLSCSININVKNNVAYIRINPLNYVGPVSDTQRLYTDIARRYAKYGHENVLIIMDGYWPLPYYMQEHKIEYLSNQIQGFNLDPYLDKYDMFIVSKDSLSENTNLKSLGGSYELREGIFVDVLVKH